MYCEHCQVELTKWETDHQVLAADPEEGYRRGFLDYNYCPDCGTELYY